MRKNVGNSQREERDENQKIALRRANKMNLSPDLDPNSDLG